jgi:hypothetical protein
METSRSGSANGIGARITACSTVKIAVLAPMQRQRQKRSDGESLLFPEKLESKTQILQHVVNYVGRAE